MILECFTRQQEHIVTDLPLIKRLQREIGHPTDLSTAQYLCWYAIVLDFKPDLVIELGRGYGNSTALFTLAAQREPGLSIHSFDLGDVWERETKPKLTRFTGSSWFSPLVTHTGDLTGFDFSPLLTNRFRVLVLLDAHGFAVAERLLTHILPLVTTRQHLILCHDISDNRFMGDDYRPYGNRRFWRGMEDWYGNQDTTAYVNLGWASGVVDQIIPLLDFCYRNRIELHSADDDFSRSAVHRPDLLKKLTSAIPEIIVDSRFHFAWFTLNETTGPYHFPAALPGRTRFRTRTMNAWRALAACWPLAERTRRMIWRCFGC